MNTTYRTIGLGAGRNTHLGIGRAFVLLAAIGGVACSDSTGTGDDFDPGAASAVVSDLLGAASDNRAVQSLTVLGSKIRLPAVASAGEPTGNAPSFGSIPILEPGLGHRLVYDLDTEAYVFDATAGDTPQDAVRFVLYDVDVQADRVNVPLEPLGDLDVTDRSDATDRVGVRAVLGTETAIDYVATATGNIIGSALVHSVDGIVAVEGGSIDLDLEQQIAGELTGSGSILLDYRLAREQGAVRLQLDFDFQTGIATTVLTVEFGGTVVSMTTSGSPASIDGTVRAGNSNVVQIGGTSAAPLFTNNDGQPIIGQDLTALMSLFSSAELLLGTIDATLAPAYWAFGLSVFFSN